MLKTVLDTNIFVSAFIKKGGYPDQILRQSGSFYICISEPIIDEIRKVLNYERLIKKYNYDKDDINNYIDELKQSYLLVKKPIVVKVIKEDPEDDNIISCALGAEAHYIVSGDHHLTDLKEYEGIKIVTPKEFLDILKSET